MGGGPDFQAAGGGDVSVVAAARQGLWPTPVGPHQRANAQRREAATEGGSGGCIAGSSARPAPRDEVNLAAARRPVLLRRAPAAVPVFWRARSARVSA